MVVEFPATCQDGALWDLGTQIEILLRVLQKIDELHDLNFCLLAAGDVLEGHVDLAGVDQLGRRLAHAAEDPASLGSTAGTGTADAAHHRPGTPE